MQEYGLLEVIQDVLTIHGNLYTYPDRLTEEGATQNLGWLYSVAVSYPQMWEMVGEVISVNASTWTGENFAGG